MALPSDYVDAGSHDVADALGVAPPSSLPSDPGVVLNLVHDLERQAAETTDPVIRQQLLRAGCDLLDNALKQMHLPAA